jgi:cysteine sulfinate desulfinase/cysteine desulfurase-like protein
LARVRVLLAVLLSLRPRSLAHTCAGRPRSLLVREQGRVRSLAGLYLVLRLVPNASELAISTGSACTFGAPEPSHVLLAIGLSRDMASSTIRIGVGRFNTEEEMERAAGIIARTVERLARMRV